MRTSSIPKLRCYCKRFRENKLSFFYSLNSLVDWDAVEARQHKLAPWINLLFLADENSDIAADFTPLNSSDLKKKFEDLVNIGAKQIKEENSKTYDDQFSKWRKENGWVSNKRMLVKSRKYQLHGGAYNLNTFNLLSSLLVCTGAAK